jgi:type VI protein secretion system component Hcp
VNTSRALTLFLPLLLLGFVFLALSAPTARAADPVIVRVNVGGATSGSCGGTWETACDLQYALTSTVGAAELWVAAGVYTPTAGTDRTATFQLRNDIGLFGGFAGSETLRSQRNITANVTTLSGDIGTPGNADDNSYHVVTGSGVTNTAVLDGFSVTGGKASGSNWGDSTTNGGGMYNDSGSPTVANITFSGNYVYYGGGGMSNWNNSSPTLTNVTFISNTAYYGAGMYNDQSSSPTLFNLTFSGNDGSCTGGMHNVNGSSPLLTNVTFSGNDGGSCGGGMSNSKNSSPTLTNVTFTSNMGGSGGGMNNSLYSNPTLTNVTFSMNWASSSGGGMHNSYSSPTLTNVTFSNNSSAYAGGMCNCGTSSPTLTNVTFSGNSAYGGYNPGWGGGLENGQNSSPTLTNVTFSNNSANGYGGGMYNWNASNPTIRNTILWGNTAPNGPEIYDFSSTPSLSDSVVQGGYAGGTHIVTADPRLGSRGNWGGGTQTVPLHSGSSAIDAGNNSTCAATDQRGKPRVGTCDIGAFEFQGYTLAKTGGDHQSTGINTPFADSLQIALTENDGGQLVPDITITFTAPSSGPSAAWSGSLVQTATTNASGVATIGPPTANGTAGSYVVTASASGTAPVTFNLVNVPGYNLHLPLIEK